MPKLKENQIPSYRLHKQSGQAVVTLSGRDILLGKYGSAASKGEYKRVTAEWLANDRVAVGATADLTIVELIRDFLRHAEAYYRRADGTPTNETKNFRDALRPLKQLYGPTPVANFGPLALKAVRDDMIKRGWCRTNINRQVNRIKHLFRWAAAAEMIPSSVSHGVDTLPALKEGRSPARESDPVTTVPDAVVNAVKPFVSRQVWGMIELQRLTGMRPGEVVTLRGAELDRSGKVWLYKPAQHKTAHRGHKRIIYLGPQAQQILTPFLKFDPDAYIFSPADAEVERRAKKAEQRKTPLGTGNRTGTNRRRQPRKTPGDRYTVESYGRAIKDACQWAFEMPRELRERRRDKAAEVKRTDIERQTLARGRAERAAKREEWRRENTWHPHQLRHNAATRWRAAHGPEVALVLLGDKSTSMIDVYAEKDHATAQQVALKIG